jgi:hypothetical protein
MPAQAAAVRIQEHGYSEEETVVARGGPWVMIWRRHCSKLAWLLA